MIWHTLRWVNHAAKYDYKHFMYLLEKLQVECLYNMVWLTISGHMPRSLKGMSSCGTIRPHTLHTENMWLIYTSFDLVSDFLSFPTSLHVLVGQCWTPTLSVRVYYWTCHQSLVAWSAVATSWWGKPPPHWMRSSPSQCRMPPHPCTCNWSNYRVPIT